MTLTFGADGAPGAALEPVTISALEYDVLWEQLGLQLMPLVLKVPSPGRTHTERTELADQAWRSLADRGLGRPHELDPRLESLLRLLDRPDREADGRFGANRSVRWLGASRGEDAVLATLDRRGLTLREAAATGLAREVVSGLPAIPAGPGESVTLPSEKLDAAAENAHTTEEFEAELVARGIRPRDAQVLGSTVLRVKRQGQFGAAVRDKWGRRHRARRVIGFFDTEDGRYLQLRRPAPDSSAWTTISPADNRLIAHELATVLDET
ncbi:MAG TPA: ESX secretion-associated protein EspG [Pseudonocardiaceae bacterium]|jgi:hypothetical protein|nr:ESX secretion-associated protein EspG [Pseudonocardiaceae bacterium]